MNRFTIGERVARVAGEHTGTFWREPSEREQLELLLQALGLLFLLVLILVLVAILVIVLESKRRRRRAAPSNPRRGRAASRKTGLPLTTAAARSKAGVLDTPVLGGTRGAWVRAKGDPTQGVIGEVFAPDTEVMWARDATGTDRAQCIEVLLRSAGNVALARDQAKTFHPPDARLTRTYVAPAGQTVEVFQSDLLAQAFTGATRPAIGSLPAAQISGDVPPSTYTLIAERGSPTAHRVVITVGNIP